MAQPAVENVPSFFVGIKGVRSRHPDGVREEVAQHVAVDVVVSVIRSGRRLSRRPAECRTDARTGVVRRVVVGSPSFGSPFASAVKLVTVVVLAITCICIEGKPAETAVPFHRRERSLRMLELVGERE